MKNALNIIMKRLKKEYKIMSCALLLAVVFTATLGISTQIYSDNVQNDIAKQVIRFHVKANSDSNSDQFLKLAVKDRILEQFEAELEGTESIEETRDVLYLKLDDIRACAQNEVRKQGYDYPVSVELTNDFFPTKYYGDIALPAGHYEALRVNIGEAKGVNWWCVMYPPLCYVDVTQQKVSDNTKSRLKKVLSEDEYKLVLLNDGKNNPEADKHLDVKIKFKIVEWWQNKKEKKSPQYVINQ